MHSFATGIYYKFFFVLFHRTYMRSIVNETLRNINGNGVIQYNSINPNMYRVVADNITIRIKRPHAVFYKLRLLQLREIERVYIHKINTSDFAINGKIYYDDNCISKIEHIPDTLKELYINNNHITKIENIPNTLQILDVSYNDIDRIENLPVSLRKFYYTGCPIKWVDNILFKDIRFSLRGYFAIIRIQKRMRRRYAYAHRYIEVNR